MLTVILVIFHTINAGNRVNIIPEKVEMLGTVRPLSTADEKMMLEIVEQVVTKNHRERRATAEILITFRSHYMVSCNDPSVIAKMLSSLQKTA